MTFLWTKLVFCTQVTLVEYNLFLKTAQMPLSKFKIVCSGYLLKSTIHYTILSMYALGAAIRSAISVDPFLKNFQKN